MIAFSGSVRTVLAISSTNVTVFAFVSKRRQTSRSPVSRTRSPATTVARTVGPTAFGAAGCGGAGLHALKIAIDSSNATRGVAIVKRLPNIQTTLAPEAWPTSAAGRAGSLFGVEPAPSPVRVHRE